MNPADPKFAEPEPAAARDTAKASEPLADLAELARTGTGMAREMLDLLAIEFELAARSLVLMIVLAIVLAAISIIAWLLLLAALGSFLQQTLGLDWAWMFVALLLVNGLVGLLLWTGVRRLSARLGLPGVRAVIRSPDRQDPAPGPEQS